MVFLLSSRYVGLLVEMQKMCSVNDVVDWWLVSHLSLVVWLVYRETWTQDSLDDAEHQLLDATRQNEHLTEHAALLLQKQKEGFLERFESVSSLLSEMEHERIAATEAVEATSNRLEEQAQHALQTEEKLTHAEAQLASR